MSSTNKTPNIQLSQFIGTDKPSWLSDYNSDMLKIDTAVGNSETGVSDAKAAANNALTIANQASTKGDTNASNIATINGQIETINQNITTVQGIANTALNNANNANSAVSSLSTTIDSWQTITFANPDTTNFTTYNFNARFNSKLQLLSIFGKIQGHGNNTFTAGKILATLPENVRPNEQKLIYMFGIGANTNGTLLMTAAYVQTNGNIVINTETAYPGNYLYFNMMLTTLGWFN